MENILQEEDHLEEDSRRKQDFFKECTIRGYKTYKDIICGNDQSIVDMLLKVSFTTLMNIPY